MNVCCIQHSKFKDRPLGILEFARFKVQNDEVPDEYMNFMEAVKTFCFADYFSFGLHFVNFHYLRRHFIAARYMKLDYDFHSQYLAIKRLNEGLSDELAVAKSAAAIE